MKKLLVLIMTIAMTCSLVACGGVDTKAVGEEFNKVSVPMDEVINLANANIGVIPEETVSTLTAISQEMAAFKADIESGELTQERADEILTSLADYADQIAALKADVEAAIAAPAEEAPAEEVPAGDAVAEDEGASAEQLQAITDMTTELSLLYNEAAQRAMENGWDTEEGTASELQTVYEAITSVQENMDIIPADGVDPLMEQLQIMLDGMPDIIDRVSEPYADER